MSRSEQNPPRWLVADPDNDKGNCIFLAIIGVLGLTFPFWGKLVVALVLGWDLSTVVWW